MAVKTITITEDAYGALKKLKDTNESFSKTILRISKRKSLNDFFGILSRESGEKLERGIYNTRKIRNKAHKLRIQKLVKSLGDK